MDLNKVIRNIYVSTMLYGVGEILFVNSFMLLYFSALGLSGERILFYLALPMLIRILTLIPFAHWTERIGKVLTGVLGLSISTAGIAILFMVGFAPVGWLEPLILMAVVLYGLGHGIYLNSWFPLLSPILPVERRGRFFGMMRFLYQSTAIIFTFIVMGCLGKTAAIGIFQGFLLIAIALRVGGIILYARIPDLETQPATGQKIFESLLRVAGKQNYLPFCCYAFLLSLFTGACVSLFGLLAKDTLGLPEGQVLLIGNASMLGALAGFFYGGIMVDKIGTKVVFLLCHVSYAVALMLFLVRDFLFFPAIVVVGTLSLLFGLIQAASGVAMSSEMLSLIPRGNKPMATALFLSLQSLGMSLSSLFCSRILKLGILAPSWVLFGHALGPYDALLLGCGTMVFLLVFTLGLVPSVVKSVQWE